MKNTLLVICGILLLIYLEFFYHPKPSVDKDDCIDSINSQKEEAIKTLYQYDSGLTYKELQEAMYSSIDMLDGDPSECY